MGKFRRKQPVEHHISDVHHMLTRPLWREESYPKFRSQIRLNIQKINDRVGEQHCSTLIKFIFKLCTVKSRSNIFPSAVTPALCAVKKALEQPHVIGMKTYPGSAIFTYVVNQHGIDAIGPLFGNVKHPLVYSREFLKTLNLAAATEAIDKSTRPDPTAAPVVLSNVFNRRELGAAHDVLKQDKSAPVHTAKKIKLGEEARSLATSPSGSSACDSSALNMLADTAVRVGPAATPGVKSKQV